MVLYQRVFIYNAISFDLLYSNSHYLLDKPYLFNFSLHFVLINSIICVENILFT